MLGTWYAIRFAVCGIGLFGFLVSLRLKIANLSPKRRSRFLTDSLLVPSITTLGIFVFFILGALNLVRALVWCILMKCGLKARARIAALRDDELSKFFLDSMMGSAFKSMTGVLFVMFRALNCVTEGNSILTCHNTVLCSTFISLYFVLFTMTKMAVGGMCEEQKTMKAISWEKIASMTGIRMRHKIEGFLTVLAGMCGMFFSA